MVSLVRPGTACLSKLTVIDANLRSSSYVMSFQIYPGASRLTVISCAMPALRKGSIAGGHYAILRKGLFFSKKFTDCNG